MTIHFDYAFAAPHTLSLSRPSASEKYLVNIDETKLQFLYSFDSLKNIHPLSWSPPKIDLETTLTIREDGQNFLLQKWERHKSGTPWLIAKGQSKVRCSLEAVAAKTGVVVKTVFENTDCAPHDITVRFQSMRGWVINNPGWIDYRNTNVLLNINSGRSDRIIGFFLGADAYPMFRNGITEVNVPMSDAACENQENSMKAATALYTLNPGETKTGFLILPYESYFDEFDHLCQLNYEAQMQDALAEWCALLDRGANISICDGDMISAFRACLATIFSLREPIGDRHGISNGNLVYRSASSGEPLLATTQLDRLGYREEASDDLPLYLEAQDDNGCWVYSNGWEREMWQLQYMKANAALQHYYFTKDRQFLADIYCRMKRNAQFNQASRQSTKNDPVLSHRGMMQRGMGDCGMMDHGDFYGFFYPSDVMAAAADQLTLKAATILGYEDDVHWLTEYCNETAQNLITSLRANSIKEDGYEWIPAVADPESTSIYGCLYAYHPAGLLSKDDPLITGTIRHVSTKGISEGGLPVGTGWLPDGIWAAMALDNFASAYLRMGMRDQASAFLYPTINHASTLVTWCEERGQEKCSSVKTGDMQHLWTPLAVVTYMLDALLYEDDQTIHICAGIPRHWLADGKTISLSGLSTRCGNVAYTIENRGGALHYDIQFECNPDRPVCLYFRTPDRDTPVILENLKGVLR